MPDLAVDDGGEAVLRVAHDVLPDVQHGSARRVDERAAAGGEVDHVLDRDAEGRKDDDVVRAEIALAFGGVAQEADAARAQPLVDVGVVDDLAGEKDVAPGKWRDRLVRVVDGAVDAVAEAELPRQVDGEASFSWR